MAKLSQLSHIYLGKTQICSQSLRKLHLDATNGTSVSDSIFDRTASWISVVNILEGNSFRELESRWRNEWQVRQTREKH